MKRHKRTARQRRNEKRKLPDWIGHEMVEGKRELRVIGLPVKIGKRPIGKFELRDRDIDRAGHTKDPTACAMANCLKREQHLDFCAVLKSVIFIHRTGSKFVERYPTTTTIRENVVIPNDCGGKVQPGRFEGIPVLSASSQATYEHGRRQGSSAKGARDRGSRDRTPSKTRLKPVTLRGVRELALD